MKYIILSLAILLPACGGGGDDKQTDMATTVQVEGQVQGLPMSHK